MNKRVLEGIFAAAAIAVLIGAATYITKWHYAPYLFTLGTAGMAAIRLATMYRGTDMRLKRLHRIEGFATVAQIAASYLMFVERNEWFMLLTIAAALQLYTSFMIPKAQQEENSDNNTPK